MMKKYPGLMKLVKANSLDPQHAKKATKEVRDHYFSKLDNFVYYPNAGKGKKLNHYKAGKVHILTAEHDGAMNHHITAAVTTQGAGKYAVPIQKVQGAPPLYLVHSSGKEKTKEKKKMGYKWYEEVEITDVLGRERKIGVAYSSGLGAGITKEIMNPTKAYKHNPYGFGVATSPNVLMTRELMLDCWTIHFVKHLPDGSDGEPKQGKGGEATILTLDGHISRWNMHALIYHMLDNNVLYPFSLPPTPQCGDKSMTTEPPFIGEAHPKRRHHRKKNSSQHSTRLIPQLPCLPWCCYVHT
eukprot:scaffold21618_cov63-Attheya_sp.AAC.9